MGVRKEFEKAIVNYWWRRQRTRELRSKYADALAIRVQGGPLSQRQSEVVLVKGGPVHQSVRVDLH